MGLFAASVAKPSFEDVIVKTAHWTASSAKTMKSVTSSKSRGSNANGADT